MQPCPFPAPAWRALNALGNRRVLDPEMSSQHEWLRASGEHRDMLYYNIWPMSDHDHHVHHHHHHPGQVHPPALRAAVDPAAVGAERLAFGRGLIALLWARGVLGDAVRGSDDRATAIPQPDAGLRPPSGRASSRRRGAGRLADGGGRPNGAGKSTLFKGVVGVIKPLAGRIERNGVRAAGHRLSAADRRDRPQLPDQRLRHGGDGPVAQHGPVRRHRPQGARRGRARDRRRRPDRLRAARRSARSPAARCSACCSRGCCCRTRA